MDSNIVKEIQIGLKRAEYDKLGFIIIYSDYNIQVKNSNNTVIGNINDFEGSYISAMEAAFNIIEDYKK